MNIFYFTIFSLPIVAQGLYWIIHSYKSHSLSSKTKPGAELEDSDAQLALQHWCLSNDNIIRSIAKVVKSPGKKISSMRFEIILSIFF